MYISYIIFSWPAFGRPKILEYRYIYIYKKGYMYIYIYEYIREYVLKKARIPRTISLVRATGIFSLVRTLGAYSCFEHPEQAPRASARSAVRAGASACWLYGAGNRNELNRMKSNEYKDKLCVSSSLFGYCHFII